MAKIEAIVDAGPLIAYFNHRDSVHNWARQQMARLSTPLYTCEAVLSETTHLLERAERGVQSLVEFLERGAIRVSFSYADNANRVHHLIRAYADQPMSFADACLVCMAERAPASELVTTDRDFHVYRTEGNEPLNVTLPD